MHYRAAAIAISLPAGRAGERAVPSPGHPSCAAAARAAAVSCPHAGHVSAGPWWVTAGVLLIGVAVFLAVAEWRPWRHWRI
jgi:hypothetical protein